MNQCFIKIKTTNNDEVIIQLDKIFLTDAKNKKYLHQYNEDDDVFGWPISEYTYIEIKQLLHNQFMLFDLTNQSED